MAKPFAYKYISYYSDGDIVKSSLKGVLLEVCSIYPASTQENSFIDPLFDDDRCKDSIKVSDYIKTIEVTSDQIKEIELRVALEIEATYKRLESFKSSGVLATGWFGITEGDRGKAIGQEIANQSKVWDLEKINGLTI